MTRKSANHKTAAASADPRAFVLAGIGAVSLGRKQAIKSYQDAIATACTLRKQARQRAQSLRAQVEAVVTPVALKAQSLATRAEAQLQPVLGKIGFAAGKRRPARQAARKASVRKPAVKRSRKSA
ncbi:MAG TPA: hypothetical protein VFY12_01400 [Arenimonas sp.]|nr:hypothetical protein [Arenimonas sp.]